MKMPAGCLKFSRKKLNNSSFPNHNYIAAIYSNISNAFMLFQTYLLSIAYKWLLLSKRES